MMGSRQEHWFYDQLSQSAERGAAWRIIGSQTVFSRQNESIVMDLTTHLITMLGMDIKQIVIGHFNISIRTRLETISLSLVIHICLGYPISFGSMTKHMTLILVLVRLVLNLLVPLSQVPVRMGKTSQ